MDTRKKAIFLATFACFTFLAGCTCFLLTGCGSDGGAIVAPAEEQEDNPPPVKLLGHLPLLSGPKGIALESSGQTVLVVEFNSGELSQVNLSSGLVKTIATGLTSPFSVVIESGGQTALVSESCPTAHRVSRINLTQGTVQDFINSPTECFTGLASETTSSVLVGEASAQISRIDTTQKTHEAILTNALLTGTRGLVTNSDDTVLVVTASPAASTGNVYRINLIDKSVQTLVNAALEINQPYGIALEAGSDSALITGEFSGILARLSNLSSQAPTLISLFQGLVGPAGVEVEASGDVLVAESTSNDLTRLNPVACSIPPCEAPEPLVPGLSYPAHLVVEEGGTTALVTEQNRLSARAGAGELSRIDVRTGKVNTLVSGLDAPEEFVVQGKLVYLVEKKSTGSLKEINLDTKQIRQVNTTPLEFPSGIVLENGTTVLVTERGAGRISRVNLSNGIVEPLTSADSLEAPSGIILENASTAIVSEIGTGDLDAGKLSRVNIATGQVQRIVTGLDFPSGIAMMPGENSVLVVEQLSGKLSRVKIAPPLSPTASSIIPVAGGLHRPERVAIEPQDNTALITETNPDGIRRIKIK